MTKLFCLGLLALPADTGRAAPDDPTKVVRLREAFLTLAPTVRPAEADRLAERAFVSAENLRQEYRIVGWPLLQNFLVNTGVKEKGLCHQWARDLGRSLSTLRLKSIDLHWGIAHAGTWREHNCIVATAAGRPLESGIALDLWRHGGRLFWSPVADDHYPWRDDKLECARLRAQSRVSPAPRRGRRAL